MNVPFTEIKIVTNFNSLDENLSGDNENPLAEIKLQCPYCPNALANSSNRSRHIRLIHPGCDDVKIESLLTNDQKSFIAGFIDGDGSIFINDGKYIRVKLS
jgi:hypothetical protein